MKKLIIIAFALTSCTKQEIKPTTFALISRIEESKDGRCKYKLDFVVPYRAPIDSIIFDACDKYKVGQIITTN